MQENELKVLLQAASMLGISANDLKPANPWSFQGQRAESIQAAVASIDPAQSARWRVEAGQGLSLGAAAAKAGITEMTNAQHAELVSLDADYAAGVEESRARREADVLASLEQGAEKLREAREKQSQQFQRQAGNTSTGAHNADFLRRIGGQAGLKQPARRLTEGR